MTNHSLIILASDYYKDFSFKRDLFKNKIIAKELRRLGIAAMDTVIFKNNKLYYKELEKLLVSEKIPINSDFFPYSE